MVGILAKTNPIGEGLCPANWDVYVTKRGGAAAKGDVVMFDLANADTATTNNTLGGLASGWKNVIEPTTALEEKGIFAVALEAIADDAEGWVRVYGIVDAFCHTEDTQDLAAGELMYLDVSVEVNALTADLPASTDNNKYLAISLEAQTTDPTTPTLYSVWFNGVDGFGHHYTA